MYIFRDGLEDPLEDHGLISQQLEQVKATPHSVFSIESR